jgi:DNA-binding XRE family transcriptional regulator
MRQPSHGTMALHWRFGRQCRSRGCLHQRAGTQIMVGLLPYGSTAYHIGARLSTARPIAMAAESHMQRFGDKLRTLRQRQGVSLRELATTLSFQSHAHLARIERVEKTPSADLILKIAEVFEVSLDQLMRADLDLDLGADSRVNTDDTA